MPDTNKAKPQTDLARILKREMLNAGYNQRSLAIAADLTPDLVRDIYRKGSHPAAEKLDALARVLKRTPAQLLGIDPIP